MTEQIPHVVDSLTNTNMGGGGGGQIETPRQICEAQQKKRSAGESASASRRRFTQTQLPTHKHPPAQADDGDDSLTLPQGPRGRSRGRPGGQWKLGWWCGVTRGMHVHTYICIEGGRGGVGGIRVCRAS